MTKCPFRNLLESEKGRWREGLTTEDMKRCRWAQAGTGRGDRVFRMDARRSATPSQVCYFAWRQKRHRSHAREPLSGGLGTLRYQLIVYWRKPHRTTRLGLFAGALLRWTALKVSTAPPRARQE
jgi:hypothetical protein